jgi:TRAP-type mannitol/chloroaromatic compound transport system substrate-binding protein|tara:strand:- start:219 stop:1319 length:1101 start_codon:yes stop_codon:yes gene_type:complete
MASFKLCKVKQNIIILFFTILLFSCTSEDKIGSPEQVKENFKWRMVTTWPKNYPGVGLGAENFAKLVDEMSDGRLKIKVYGNGELVPALEVFDTVSRGSVEMGHGASYYWIGKIPAAQFFTAIPFGLNAQEMNAWLHYGGGQELWEELYEPFNLIPMAGGNTGVQMAGWFNKEINSLEDLKGIRMRIPGMAGKVFTRAGGEAVLMPGSEIFTNLQTGVIDAAEWIGPYNDLTFGFHQAAKYYYYPGWHEPGPTLETIVNKEAFESLPKDLQTIVKTASRTINQDMLDEYTARNNQALMSLVNDHGVELRRLPDDVLAEFKKITNELLKEMIEEDESSKKIYESLSEFQKNVFQYHEISERANYNLR